MEKNFCFSFKGNRKYIQGPDVVIKLVEFFKGYDIEKIDIKFNGVSKKNLILTKGCNYENAKVNVRVGSGEYDEYFQLIESDINILESIDFDEDKIIKEFNDIDFENKKIKLERVTGFDFFENLISMNKFLHKKIYSEEKGKWYFTRLEINDYKQFGKNEYPIEIQLLKNFAFKLTKAKVLVNGANIGNIYFSLIKE